MAYSSAITLCLLHVHRELGRIANTFGAICTQSIRGVPVDKSRYDSPLVIVPHCKNRILVLTKTFVMWVAHLYLASYPGPPKKRERAWYALCAHAR